MSTETLLERPPRESDHPVGAATPAPLSSSYSSNIAIAAGPLVGLLAYFFLLLDEQEQSQRLAAMFAILLWVCVWWMTEAIPVAITALLPLVLFPLLRIANADDVARAYMNDTISLVIGSFILSLAVEKYNCHKRLALRTLLLLGGEKMDPRFLLLGFCAGPAFVSMFMSNTATAVMMIPMAVGVVQGVQSSNPHMESQAISSNPKHATTPGDELESGYDASSNSASAPSQFAEKALSEYSKGVVLAVGYGVSVGGLTTLTGTGPNLVFAGVFKSLFPNAEPVTYSQWFLFGFPLGVFFLLLMWIMLCMMYCPTPAVPVVSASLSRSTIQKQYDLLGAMSSAEKTVVSIFTMLAFMWLTRATIGDMPGWGSYFHGYAGDGTVSIFVAMFLFIFPLKSRTGEKLMNWDDCKKLPWDIILVLGGGFALADGIRQSGLAEWIAAHLDFLHSIPSILITPSLALIVTIVTEFTANVATATIFLPLMAEISVSLNIHPLFLMVTATIACSFAFMLPIATPPNAVAYTAGKLRMTDLAIPGFILKCAGIFLLSVLMPTLGTVVFNLDQTFQN